MEDGHCLQPVLLLLAVIFTMLLNELERALNVRQEDVQELVEEVHDLNTDQGLAPSAR